MNITLNIDIISYHRAPGQMLGVIFIPLFGGERRYNMAKAKKLPSGKWRTLIYDFTDNDGKRHYKSFTAETKKESEYLAAKYVTDRVSKDDDYEDLSVGEAIRLYIDVKENTLSPSTIAGYETNFRNHYSNIFDKKIRSLDAPAIQRWVGDLSQRLSPKTVSNAYGLLHSALKMFKADDKMNGVTLPQQMVNIGYIPTDAEIQTLIKHLQAHSQNLLIATCLSAFGTLRRSEICALTADDVRGNLLIINKAKVQDKHGKWIIKETPKNLSSNRIVEYPDFVINLLPKEGYLVNILPNSITSEFKKQLDKIGLPHFRFHDLRHYSASIMHAIGVPDVYIMQRGGWSDDKTLKRIYRNSLSDFQKKYTDQTNSYFNNMQHEMQHEK